MTVSGKKIIITGANGSLGVQLVNYFSTKNEVIAIARQEGPNSEIMGKCTYIQMDINNLNDQLEADILIHVAGLSDDKGKWADFYRENVLGTLKTAEMSKKVPTFIFISSSSVYNFSSRLLKEDDSEKNGTNGLSNYGKSKWIAEKCLSELSVHERCFILRPRAIYGVGDKKIIPRIFRLVKNNNLIIPGSMKIRVSMTHFSNLIHGIECCITSSLKGTHIYNISDDKTYILLDVVRQLVKGFHQNSLSENHIPIWFLKLLGRLHLAGMSPLLVRSFTNDMELDIQKIKSEIGYQAQTNLEQSLPEIAKWLATDFVHVTKSY